MKCEEVGWINGNSTLKLGHMADVRTVLELGGLGETTWTDTGERADVWVLTSGLWTGLKVTVSAKGFMWWVCRSQSVKRKCSEGASGVRLAG